MRTILSTSCTVPSFSSMSCKVLNRNFTIFLVATSVGTRSILDQEELNEVMRTGHICGILENLKLYSDWLVLYNKASWALQYIVTDQL
jgi:hypothetical protein